MRREGEESLAIRQEVEGETEIVCDFGVRRILGEIL